VQTLASIIATPAAALDRDREVLLVFTPEQAVEPVPPAAPAAAPKPKS